LDYLLPRIALGGSQDMVATGGQVGKEPWSVGHCRQYLMAPLISNPHRYLTKVMAGRIGKDELKVISLPQLGLDVVKE